MSLKKYTKYFLGFREIDTRVYIFPSMNFPLPPIIQNNTKWLNQILKILDLKDFVHKASPAILTSFLHFSQSNVMESYLLAVNVMLVK